MPYQINTSKLFLTYPQCPLDKNEAFTLICQLFAPIDEYIVASELHQNGDPHLHVYLQLPQPYRTRDPTFADLKKDGITYHGNYQGCRSAKNVIKYCTKDDNFISNMDVAAILEKKSNRKIIARKIVHDGLELIDIMEEFPDLIFGYKKLKDDINQYRHDAKDQRTNLPPWLPNPWGKVLPSTLHKKRRHYWIFSRAPNKGKTYHFAKPLFNEYKCGLQCGDFSYWQLGGSEKCIIIDEYNTAKLKYSELNSMADGHYGFRIFQGGIIRLRDPLIIILSNQSIVDLYPNMNNLLYERFNEIEIL